jgi:hypothetical protein
MAKALSGDLRRRVIEGIDRRPSSRQAGETVRGERVERDPMA